MRRPDLFIIGAPKCGTTSLADWLEQHPETFFASKPPQEPNFFNSDHLDRSRLSLERYEALFAGAGPGHRAVAEKSVWYLVSECAVPRILDYSPGARFIVCLRNPIEMAHALYHEQAFAGIEPLPTFRAAWLAQDERASRKGAQAASSTYLLYGPTCQLGRQIELLGSRVPAERLHLLFMEDMRSDPNRTYRDVLRFLGLSPFTPEARIMNEAKARRSRLIGKLTIAAGAAKRAAGLERGLGLLDRVNRWNRVRHEWRPDPEMIPVLRSYFEDDILLLGRLMQRDLSHWLRWPGQEIR